jgi:ER degradation enhancer, mannosidase alpha-like 1
LFGEESDYEKYEQIAGSIKHYLRRGREKCSSGIGHHPVYVNVNMKTGQVFNNWVDSMQASYPGVQVLMGDLDEAICMHAFYFAIWKKFDVLPERYNWNLKMPDVYFYPLRPEFAEANYFLYKSTHSPFYLHVAKMIIENINEICRVK